MSRKKIIKEKDVNMNHHPHHQKRKRKENEETISSNATTKHHLQKQLKKKNFFLNIELFFLKPKQKKWTFNPIKRRDRGGGGGEGG